MEHEEPNSGLQGSGENFDLANGRTADRPTGRTLSRKKMTCKKPDTNAEMVVETVIGTVGTVERQK